MRASIVPRVALEQFEHPTLVAHRGRNAMSEKKTLGMEEIVTERKLGRRSTMGIIGAGALGAAVAAVGITATASTAEAQCSDSDPYDPAGRGRSCGCRGISDSDPYDPVGCGRRSCSDSDPYDPAGAGRHC
jgi:hypothetical protein